MVKPDQYISQTNYNKLIFFLQKASRAVLLFWCVANTIKLRTHACEMCVISTKLTGIIQLARSPNFDTCMAPSIVRLMWPLERMTRQHLSTLKSFKLMNSRPFIKIRKAVMVHLYFLVFDSKNTQYVCVIYCKTFFYKNNKGLWLYLIFRTFKQHILFLFFKLSNWWECCSLFIYILNKI